MNVLAADLKAEGVTVINCTPRSALTCFPMGDLDRSFAKCASPSSASGPSRSPPFLFTDGLKRLGYTIIHRQNPDPRDRPKSRDDLIVIWNKSAATTR